MAVYLQIVAENLNKTVINILELSESDDDISSFRNVIESFNKTLNIAVQHKIINRKKALEERVHFLTDVDLLLVKNLSTDDKVSPRIILLT